MRVVACRPVFAVLLCLGANVTASAADALHVQIDRQIAAQIQGSVAEVTNDAAFLRRVHLDFAGVIPTAAETQEFLASNDTTKRTKLIDRLLASPAYSRRMRDALTVMLLERRSGSTVPLANWNTFLESSFAANKPWDQLVLELIQADAAKEGTAGTVKFFAASGRTDLHQATQDVARLFLGMNIHCAKCHDHPTVDEYKQADYFGLFAYLGQSKVGKHSSGTAWLVENIAAGKTEFASVFEPDLKHLIGPRLPGRSEVEVVVFEKGQELAEPAKDGLPGIPKFRPRLLLADHLATADNRRFVENSVNRFWFLMMGRGLVSPLDMLHKGNPASHPQLLKVLADEFVSHKFDVRWLLREIALSQSYQRSGVLPEGVKSEDAPATSYRAANPKGLSPEQMAWSVMRATGNLERIKKTQRPADSKFSYKDYINARIPAPDNLEDTMTLFTSIFGNPPGEAETQFQPSMGQALFLMNEPLLLDWLKPRDGNLVERLGKQDDSAVVIQQLYLNILSRLPDETEQSDLVAWLDKRKDRRSDAISECAWALLTSTEFRLNH
jgi:hypothetical protein